LKVNTSSEEYLTCTPGMLLRAILNKSVLAFFVDRFISVFAKTQ